MFGFVSYPQQSLQCVAVLIMSGVANWYMFISGAIVITILALFYYYYMKSAMEMKRLEAAGMQKCPVVDTSHWGLMLLQSKQQAQFLIYA